jgi:molecular chaperone GrpE
MTKNNNTGKKNNTGSEDKAVMADRAEISEVTANESADTSEETPVEEMNELTQEMLAVKESLEEKTKQFEEIFEKLQRTVAEFDNYKKRTQKEKDNIYNDAVGDVIRTFLPVIDSMEQAVKACSDGSEGEDADKCIRDGVELVKKQLTDVLGKLGVEEIPSEGECFDPELHNAVMHVEDEELQQNVVVEEFQKGYKTKNRVIRHSMVKVAN